MGATNTNAFCLNSAQALENALSGGSVPKNGAQETLGTLRATTSAENMQGFDFEESGSRTKPDGSSNRKVTIYGNAKNCATVETGGFALCDTETPETTDFVDEELTVDNERHVTRTYNRELYRDTCDTADGRAASKIAENLIWDAYQILKVENEDIIDAFIAGADSYYDTTSAVPGGATEKDIPLYSSTAPVVPQPGNLQILRDEYNRKGYGTIRPMAVGGSTLDRWAYDTGLFSGDTASTGRDITKVDSPIANGYIDYEVDNNVADGSSHLITWVPGHMQMLYWLDFGEGSPLARSNGEITKTTITLNLPFIGPQTFDYIVYDPNCDELVHVTIRRFSEPWIINSNFFAAGKCGGEQSLLGWLLSCSDTTCDDIQRPGNIIT